MKAKLDKAFTKAYAPGANDIIKGMKKDMPPRDENIMGRRQEFDMTHPLSQNQDPNRGAAPTETSQEVWATEMRKQDDRISALRTDLATSEQRGSQLNQKAQQLEKMVKTREEEILRQSALYQGGQTFSQIKSGHSARQADETINKQVNQIEILNTQNHHLSQELSEIRELLGMCETKEPTNKDRVNLGTLAKKLKAKNDNLTSDLKAMERVVEQLKNERVT